MPAAPPGISGGTHFAQGELNASKITRSARLSWRTSAAPLFRTPCTLAAGGRGALAAPRPDPARREDRRGRAGAEPPPTALYYRRFTWNEGGKRGRSGGRQRAAAAARTAARSSGHQPCFLPGFRLFSPLSHPGPLASGARSLPAARHSGVPHRRGPAALHPRPTAPFRSLPQRAILVPRGRGGERSALENPAAAAAATGAGSGRKAGGHGRAARRGPRGRPGRRPARQRHALAARPAPCRAFPAGRGGDGRRRFPRRPARVSARLSLPAARRGRRPRGRPRSRSAPHGPAAARPARGPTR